MYLPNLDKDDFFSIIDYKFFFFFFFFFFNKNFFFFFFAFSFIKTSLSQVGGHVF